MPYIIADTHIQSNDEYQLLVKLVRQLAEDDDVILLGDIFDFTKIPFADLEYLIDDFDHPHIYYIYGNHDIVAPELGFKCYDKLKYDGVLFEHGHRYEALLKSTGFTTPEEYNELFKRLCYNRNTIGIGAKLSWLIWNSITKYKRNLHSRELACELFKHLSKIGNVVIGHTHYEMFSKTRRVLICDDAKLSNISRNRRVSGRTTEASRPVGYFLQTDTFTMETFDIDAKANIRSALNTKRNCLHERS